MNTPCLLVQKRCLPCNDDPIRNITAEAPDVNVFIGFRDYKWNPPLGVTYFQLACKTICFSTVSQAAADLCALQSAQDCVYNGGEDPVTPPVPPGPDDGGGAGGGTGLPPGNPRNPIRRYQNAAQSCDSECPSGSPFTETVASGTITELSQALADAKAKSLACKLAVRNLFCISASPPPASCVGESYFFLITTNIAEGLIWSVDGSLPPGLNFNFDGTITGTPLSGGSYTFVVEVSDSLGRFQSQVLTICIMEIVTAETLPEATVGEVYAEPIIQQPATVSSEVWTLVSGSLPPGILLSSNGSLTGIATEAGLSQFTLQVDAICEGRPVSCQKTFTLEATEESACGVDWSAITWDTASFFTEGATATATGSAAGPNLSFELAGGNEGSGVAKAEVHGFVISDCNACSFRIRITLVSYQHDAVYGVRMFQDGVAIFSNQYGPLPDYPKQLSFGLNEFSASLVEATGSLIEIEAFVLPLNDIMGIAGPIVGTPVPSISISMTISDT